MRRALLLLVPAVFLVAACGAVSSTGTPTTGSVTAPPRTATTSAVKATAAGAGGVKLVKVASFDSPVDVVGDPDDANRLFVVEQAGRIRVVDHGKTAATPFLDIRSQVTSGGEQGLLGLVFAPGYAQNGRFYVYFTGKDQKQHVVEYRRATADAADSDSARPVLVMDDPEPNHNGGDMHFGPDKLLYIGTGDGGGGGDAHGPRGNAQNLKSLLGKLLRIDPRKSGSHAYTIPKGNPFRKTARPPGVRPEIYAYGLRNPWRWSFDRKTGDLTIGDVGEHLYEEIDFRKRGTARGANFGWHVWEGRSRFRPAETAKKPVFPLIVKRHDNGWCAIIGGVVVRDPSVPALNGRYVYGDECEGHLWSAKLSQKKATGDKRAIAKRIGTIVSFGEDAAGHVYLVTYEGAVYRLAKG